MRDIIPLVFDVPLEWLLKEVDVKQKEQREHMTQGDTVSANRYPSMPILKFGLSDDIA